MSEKKEWETVATKEYRGYDHYVVCSLARRGDRWQCVCRDKPKEKIEGRGHTPTAAVFACHKDVISWGVHHSKYMADLSDLLRSLEYAAEDFLHAEKLPKAEPVEAKPESLFAPNATIGHIGNAIESVDTASVFVWGAEPWQDYHKRLRRIQGLLTAVREELRSAVL